jgi:hypothetical protein
MLHGSPTRHVRFMRLAGMLTDFIIQTFSAAGSAI